MSCSLAIGFVNQSYDAPLPLFCSEFPTRLRLFHFFLLIDNFDALVQSITVVPDDPCIAIEYAPPNDIHAALALAGAPCPRGGNATGSFQSLNTYIFNLIVGIAGNGCRVPHLQGPGFSTAHFQRLTIAQFVAITNALYNPGNLPWIALVGANDLSCGTFYQVVTNGAGGNNIVAQNLGAFLG
jgi:hypothetical protein